MVILSLIEHDTKEIYQDEIEDYRFAVKLLTLGIMECCILLFLVVLFFDTGGGLCHSGEDEEGKDGAFYGVRVLNFK